jgi:hypothetical protein
VVASGRLDLVRYRTADGRTITLPTQYARTDGRIVIVVGRPAEKRWWRHFRTTAPAEICLRRRWHAVELGVVHDPARRDALVAAYLARFPRAASAVRDAVVLDGRLDPITAS